MPSPRGLASPEADSETPVTKINLEAAAFPLPDVHYGQTVAAAIAPRPGEEVAEATLREMCQQAMGDYRAPSRYFFLDELPKGPSGKIQRLKLAERFAESA